MDFNVKKLVKDAGSALSRVVQVNKKYSINYYKKSLCKISFIEKTMSQILNNEL